jgi:bifunctional enzyme CysN/CysC
MAELLRFATAGSVDDGKSTLIGRLLYDTKSIFEDQLEAVERTSRDRGDEYTNLALLTDGLRAEREQGITIDVAYRYFATPKRRFIIADTPGHLQYTRNMVTGASTADLALILVDARKGVLEQSRRHAFLSALLGIPHLVLCINKMDLVDWSQEVFENIKRDFRDFAAKLDVRDLTFIPISALLGDNIVNHSDNMPWYEGTTLLTHLEDVHVASDRNLIDARFPVQYVIRPISREYPDYRGFAGSVAGGVFKPGDEVVVLPSNRRTRIKSIDTFDGPVDEAFTPMAVTLTLADDVDVSRGDIICRPANQPMVGQELDATVCWMTETSALAPGKRYLMKHGTKVVRATVTDIQYRLDVNTLHRDETAATLTLNEIGRVQLRTAVPVYYDEYRRNRSTGSFILIDEATNATAGAGMLIPAWQRGTNVGQETSPNVVWNPGSVDRADRWATTGMSGATIWMTGLSASGKSTIAFEMERMLLDAGRACVVLDGDNLRHGLNADLGFTAADRAENVRRAGAVAQLMAEAGLVVIVPIISPYEDDRAKIADAHRAAGLPYWEVFVNTPIDECERRDPKGLYRRARAGEITGFTGIDDPYEAPRSPALELRPSDGSSHQLAARVLELIDAPPARQLG